MRRWARYVGLTAVVVGLASGPWVSAWVVAGAAVAGGFGLAATGAGRIAVVAPALLLGAALVSDARLAALERSALGPSLGPVQNLIVDVGEPPRTGRFGQRAALAQLRGEPVLLRLPSGVTARTGDRLSVTGTLLRPSPFAARRGAHAELRATRVASAGRRGGAAGFVDGVRRRAEAALARGGLPAAPAGLLRGMVLGDDSALPADLRDAFRTAGLSHLVAASGTNVVLLATLALGLGAAIGLGLSGRAWLALGLVALYVPLAGAGPSIQRAGLMGVVTLVAVLAGRPGSRWYALGLAAAATLLFEPRAVGDPGWQLSFAAVVAIGLLAPRWRAALRERRVPGALADVVAMTAAASIATAPIVAAHFDRASLVSLPVNVLAAPLVAPIMWLGVVAAALGQLPAMEPVVDALVALCGLPLACLTWLGRTGAVLPGATAAVGVGTLAAAAVAVGAATWSARVRRAAPAVALAAAVVVVLFGPSRPALPGPPDGLRVTLLDVGQGDATLVQAPGVTVLVDAGPPDGPILARLAHAGVRRLDLLVVTHAQADHEGGAPAVLDALEVAAVLDGRDGRPSPALDAALRRTRGVRRLLPDAGGVVRLGPLALRVLWPAAEPLARHALEDPNERALVLEAELGARRVLLPADAESEVLTRLDLRSVDVLKVSHHGSADPGLPAVLARLRPRIAGIEVGRSNTYGHPAPATLEALRAVPTVVRTDRDGSVRLDAGPDGSWTVRTVPGDT